MPASSAPTHVIEAGLRSADQLIPLEGVSVEAEVSDVVAHVTITQRYRNRESKPIEAVYVFPLDEMAALCGFDAIVDGKVFTGQVEPRDTAFKKYDDALAQGHGAYLLDEELPDVFTASVGNIPPGAEALLRITYVAELTLEGDALRFTLPTTVSPRYAPDADRKGVGRPASEALNPPVMWQVPYGLSFTLRATMPGAITRVESPSHPISVKTGGNTATVTLSQASAALDRDVVVLIDADDVHAPHVLVERDEQGRLAAALVARPRFETTQAPAEVIFVVDRSGSMEGTSIAEVRNALQLCLRSLTAGCRFNIVGFGDRYTSLFDASRPYDQATLDLANAHIQTLDADLGGTNILPALAFALDRPQVPGLVRQLVVLTDGDVTNSDEVVSFVAKHSANARVFAFGIGQGASAHLVRGIARAGQGVAEFILPGTRIEATVVRQIGRLLSPAVSGLSIAWGDLAATPVPSRLPAVFAGSRLIAYAFLTDVTSTTVTVSGHTAAGAFSVKAAVDPAAVTPGRSLGTLAARARIRELQDDAEGFTRRGSQQRDRAPDRTTEEIIDLSVRYTLMSRETSFVVVERREGAAPGEMELRRIPVALRSGWGGLDQAHIQRLAAPLRSAYLGDNDGEYEASEFDGPRVSYSRAEPPAARPIPEFLSGPTDDIRRRLSHATSRATGLEGRSPAMERRVPSRMRPHDHLIAAQRADGSWDLSTALADVLRIDLRVLEAHVPYVTTIARPDRVWATLLALTWLHLRAGLHQDEWHMLAEKAEAWLSTQGPDALITAARQVAEEVVRK